MTNIVNEKPFKNTMVYYSGSIRGVEETDAEFPELLIQYMLDGGAQIIDPHVSISSRLYKDRFISALVGLHGVSAEAWDQLSENEQAKRIYEKDISLVDKATHIVMLLNGPSWGVGMELQEALRKPQLGLKPTPILGLVRHDYVDKISFMVKGAEQMYPNFTINIYKDFQDAQNYIFNFLTRIER